MLGRLFIGIVKGLLIGGLLGFGLAQLGFAAPSWFIAYLAAALVGVLVGLIAGKPIWAGDAKIEAGLKAFVGALLGAGLMFAARKWLTMTVPLQISGLTAPNASLGGLSITSLPMIAALLGAFYEVDNDPNEGQPKGPSSEAALKGAAGGPRVASAAASDDAELDDDEVGEADAGKKRAQK